MRTLADVISNYNKLGEREYAGNKFEGWNNSAMKLANEQQHYIAEQEALRKAEQFKKYTNFYKNASSANPNSLAY